MPTPQAQITESLAGAANATVTQLYGLGRDAEAPADEFPLAQIIERLDLPNVCPLCASVHGMIVDRKSAAFAEFRWPSHINCRRTIVYIGKDEVDETGEPTKPDFQRPHQDIINQHGHFHVDPGKYAELRIPSRPEGRDFIFVRGLQGRPGHLLWRDALSKEAIQATLTDMYKVIEGAELTELAMGERCAALVRHASEAASYENFDDDLDRHRADWLDDSGLFLEDMDYAALPWFLAAHPDTWVCSFLEGGAARIGLFSPRLALPHLENSVHNIAAVYTPRAGRLQQVGMRAAKGPDYFRNQDGFKPIRGNW